MQNLEVTLENEVAARTLAGGFRTELNVAGHPLVADEPASVGGTAEGPTPYDLLSAALASCTTMTLMMYAKHKGIELEAVTVRVRHEKVHAKDCEDCETAAGRIDEFVRELVIEGEISEQQRQRMLEIADRCPVHRSLHSEVKIRTVIADD
jgi:putative redox protein